LAFKITSYKYGERWTRKKKPLNQVLIVGQRVGRSLEGAVPASFASNLGAGEAIISERNEN